MTYNLTIPTDIARFYRDGKAMVDMRKRVSLKECADKRTLSQNKLYWLWLTCVAQETGNDKDALHEFFKKRFLDIHKHDLMFPNGYERVIVQESTTGLDTKRMKMYLDCVRDFVWHELGISLLLPQERGYEEFYEKYRYFIN
jgi:hypothetical protein